MRVLLVWPNKDQWGFKPMGLSLLTALLRQGGHEVALFDTTYLDFSFQDNTEVRSRIKIFKPVDFGAVDLKKQKLDLKQEFIKKLENFKPQIVGVSALSDEVDIGFKISEITKTWNPKTIVIWGNKAATMAPEKILKCVFVDYICLGEGIEFISEFIDCIEQSKDPKQIPNIAFRDEQGVLQRNSLRPYFQDLDGLPYFDWSLFDERHFLKPYDGKLYRGGDHMIFWGCPNICTYCINAAYRKLYGLEAGPFLRRYSVSRIIEELKFLVKTWGIELFKYHDEDFCLKPINYFRELVDKYTREVGVPFVAMANARNINEEKVALLKKMNCWSITLGIETGNNWLRKDILKRIETEQEIIRASKLLNKAGIRTSAFNMLAIPFENRKTIMQTIELNKQAEIRYPNAGFFFPLEGTELREISIKRGFFDGDEKASFRNDRPTLKFPDISEKDLIALRERFVLYIKMPYEFYPYIERSEKEDEIGKALTKELYQIYDECVFPNEGIWDDKGKKQIYLQKLQSLQQGISITSSAGLDLIESHSYFSQNRMRKIAIITGSRGEYGYIKPVIRAIEKDKGLDYFVLATNMHLLTEFGYSLEEMKKDGIKVQERIFNTFDGYNPLTMAKSLGVFLMQLPEFFDRTKPDIILIAGDRGEQLMAAIAGAYMYIPVAHIQAGEISGNIDGTSRHAITKFSHLHFCANREFGKRVKAMGEQDFRIFITGAPQLDELLQINTNPSDIFNKYRLNPEKPLFILMQHPVTDQYEKAGEQMAQTLEALKNFDAQTVLIFPNSDAGNKELKKTIEKYYNQSIRLFRNLPRNDYLALLKNAKAIIGNSSSAIIEAPLYKVSAVNIGTRQQGRLQAENVINAPYNYQEIAKSIAKAISPEFNLSLKNCISPYGDGNSAEKIVKILKEVKIDDTLLNKKLTY